MQAVKKLLDRCASPDVTMHEVDGGAHELFMGMERELVTQHVISWVSPCTLPCCILVPSKVSKPYLYLGHICTWVLIKNRLHQMHWICPCHL